MNTQELYMLSALMLSMNFTEALPSSWPSAVMCLLESSVATLIAVIPPVPSCALPYLLVGQAELHHHYQQ